MIIMMGSNTPVHSYHWRPYKLPRIPVGIPGLDCQGGVPAEAGVAAPIQSMPDRRRPRDIAHPLDPGTQMNVRRYVQHRFLWYLHAQVPAGRWSHAVQSRQHTAPSDDDVSHLQFLTDICATLDSQNCFYAILNVANSSLWQQPCVKDLVASSAVCDFQIDLSCFWTQLDTLRPPWGSCLRVISNLAAIVSLARDSPDIYAVRRPRNPSALPPRGSSIPTLPHSLASAWADLVALGLGVAPRATMP